MFLILILNKDFKEYQGIRLKVRGNGEKYLLWVRTPAARFPWDRYSYEFLANSDWKEIEVPLIIFKRQLFICQNH